jgi:hypothetical protein
MERYLEGHDYVAIQSVDDMSHEPAHQREPDLRIRLSSMVSIRTRNDRPGELVIMR